MFIVFSYALLQGVMQVVGVTSIFPFLALASDSENVRNSRVGSEILAKIPAMTDAELLMAAGILAIVLLFITNLVNIGAEVSRNRYAQLFGHWLRLRIMSNVVSQPYEYFYSHNTSRIIKIITGDVFTFTNGVFLPILDTVARVVIVILMVLTLFLIHPSIALGTSFLFGVFYIIVFLALRKIRKSTSEGTLEAGRATIKDTQQLLTGIKSIKAQGSENYFYDRFRNNSKRMADLMSWVNVYGNGPRYLIEPLSFGALVVVVLYMSAKGTNLSGILPDLGVMALAGYRLMPAVQLIYSQLNQIMTMSYAFDEVKEELSNVPMCASAAVNINSNEIVRWKHTMILKNVTYYYLDEHRPVLKNVNVEIRKGDFIGVIGVSGSGKSTLADVIMGILTPLSGTVLIDGEPLCINNVSGWRKNVAYVPQDVFLIDDTIAANVAFGVREDCFDHSLMKEVCAKARILDFIQDELDDGFYTIVGERGIRLSGGQRQRIGLARALYRKPDLLVLDEATSALDNETESSVIDAIFSLKNEITLLVVAHRLSTIENCDSWWRVENGRVEVLSRPIANRGIP